MKTIIVASMDRNGVIGRTSKPCEGYPLLEGITERRECHGGKVHRIGPPGTYGLAIDDCLMCNGTGRVPANDVPWSYPEIDIHFERETMGHAVVMGRRTWEARGGRPLAGRANVVISRHMFDGEPGVYVATTLDGALRMVRAYEETNDTTAYFTGGAKLFRDALPLANELDLTLIDRTFEGDVKFPGYDEAIQTGLSVMDRFGFVCVERRQGSTPELTFTRWCRK